MTDALAVPSETTALLRSLRRWLLVAVVLLGTGVLTLAHVGYVQNDTALVYWQQLVFSIAGVVGGGLAVAAAATALYALLGADPAE